MKVEKEIKRSFVEWSILAGLLVAYLVVGTMDYNDAVAQHEVNCSSATYSSDNNLECEGE